MFLRILALFAIRLDWGTSDNCPSTAPLTMSNFEPKQYEGVWYVQEIGSGWHTIATSCVTEEFVQRSEHAFLYNAIWRGKVYGKLTNNSGIMALDAVDMSTPFNLSPRNVYYGHTPGGHSGQKVKEYRSTIVKTDYVTWALEYSCGALHEGLKQMYTIRSRKPTLDSDTLNMLKRETEQWNLPLQTPTTVNHESCQ